MPGSSLAIWARTRATAAAEPVSKNVAVNQPCSSRQSRVAQVCRSLSMHVRTVPAQRRGTLTTYWAIVSAGACEPDSNWRLQLDGWATNFHYAGVCLHTQSM
jgi:hypothetical protein